MSEVLSGQATHAIPPVAGQADVLVVGGGLSGTMLAVQLLRLPGRRRVLVIEPRAELGRGEAYSATELGHTLNGNAARMSVDPDNPDDLTQWLEAYIADGGWPESDQQHVPVSELFMPRGIFGLYVQQRLAEAREQGAAWGSTAEHVRGEVVDLQADSDGVRLTLADGQQLQAAHAVLATGMFPAARTRQKQSSGLNAAAVDPWDVAAMSRLDPQGTILIIGSGLTMVDAVVSWSRPAIAGRSVFSPAMACCRMSAVSRRPGSISWPLTMASAARCNCCAKCAGNVPRRSTPVSTGKHRWIPCAPISADCGARPPTFNVASSYGMYGPGGRATTTARRR